MNAWFVLIIAGLLEVCWAASLKSTEGFTRLIPTLFFVATLAGSMYLLAVAARTLPIGTAYAVWVGIGAAGTAVAGIVLHAETVSFTRVFFLLVLVGSIVGLKLTAPEH